MKSCDGLCLGSSFTSRGQGSAHRFCRGGANDAPNGGVAAPGATSGRWPSGDDGRFSTDLGAIPSSWIQWLFLVPLIGGIGGIFHTIHVWYIDLHSPNKNVGKYTIHRCDGGGMRIKKKLI